MALENPLQGWAMYLFKSAIDGAGYWDLADGSTIPGTLLQGYTMAPVISERPNQWWRLIPTNNADTFQIVNAAGRTALELSSTTNGTQLTCQKVTSPPTSQQQWRVYTHWGPKGGNYHVFSFQNQATGQYIDLRGGLKAPKTPIQGWQGDAGNLNQLWEAYTIDFQDLV